MSNDSLFRREALQQLHGQWLGCLQLGQPISFAVLSAIASCFAVAILCFVFFASYTRKASVTGQLVPAGGIASVVSPGAGTLSQVFRREGSRVVAGEKLALLSVPRATTASSDMRGALDAQISARANSLDSDFAANSRTLAGRSRDFDLQLSSARTELRLLEAERETIRKQQQTSERMLARLRELGQQRFVSELQLQQQENAVLDQVNRGRSLEREEQTTRRGILQLEQGRRELSSQMATLRSDLVRDTSLLNQERLENDVRSEAILVAPVTGLVASQSVEPGQALAAGQTVMNLLPDGANLEAHLWVPSRSVGFVHEGTAVLLRYQAFPSAKFGRYTGKVQRISRNALSMSELQAIASPVVSDEHYYRVVVRLDRQSVLAYGKSEALRPGMLVDADILLDRRRLFDWLMEPLYSIHGDWGDH
jgi:membrane fusion protein